MCDEKQNKVLFHVIKSYFDKNRAGVIEYIIYVYIHIYAP